MSPDRKPLWARKRTEWHKDAARTRLRETADYLPITLLVFAALLAAAGVSHLEEPSGWISLGGSLLCLAILWGLRGGKEWARLLGGGVAALLALVGTVSLVVALVDGRELGTWRWVRTALIDLVWWMAAFSLLGRKGRETFADARARLAAQDED